MVLLEGVALVWTGLLTLDLNHFSLLWVSLFILFSRHRLLERLEVFIPLTLSFIYFVKNGHRDYMNDGTMSLNFSECLDIYMQFHIGKNGGFICDQNQMQRLALMVAMCKGWPVILQPL